MSVSARIRLVLASASCLMAMFFSIGRSHGDEKFPIVVRAATDDAAASIDYSGPDALTGLTTEELQAKVKQLSELLQGDPQNVKLLLERGWLYLSLDDLEKAQSDLSRVVEGFAGKRRGMARLGAAAGSLGTVARRSKRFQQGSRVRKARPIHFRRSGLGLRAGRRYAQCAVSYTLAILTNPFDDYGLAYRECC